MKELIELFNTYSLLDIITFLALLAGSIMGVGGFYEWASARLTKIFGKEHRAAAKEQALNDRIKKIEDRLDANDALRKESDRDMRGLADKIDLLIDSDKDSIKAWLTDKHHLYVYQIGWIDDYNLDCIERRYTHYKKAGGNSFVDHLMEELRFLPTQKPE